MVVRANLLAALGAEVLLELGISHTDTKLRLKVPVLAEHPRITVAYAHASIPTLKAMLLELCKVRAEELGDRVDVTEVVLTTQQMSRDRLSEREIEILVGICRGLSTQEIADKLFISKRTVDKHRANILEKSGCKNSTSLVVYAIKNGLVEL